MKAETIELDAYGIFPEEKEDENSFVKRGKDFLNAAHELKAWFKTYLEKDPTIVREKIYKTYPQLRKNLEFELVEPKLDFFKKYELNPDWVSVVDCNALYLDRENITLGIRLLMQFNEFKIPFALISSSGGVRDHEIIHCIREPVSSKEVWEETLVEFFSFSSPEEIEKTTKLLESNLLFWGILCLGTNIPNIINNNLLLGSIGTAIGGAAIACSYYLSKKYPKRIDNLEKTLEDSRLLPVFIRLDTREVYNLTENPTSYEEIKKYLEKKKSLRHKIILEKFF